MWESEQEKPTLSPSEPAPQKGYLTHILATGRDFFKSWEGLSPLVLVLPERWGPHLDIFVISEP